MFFSMYEAIYYLRKRPMLICGILCAAVAIIGYKSPTLLFVAAVVLALIFGCLLFKNPKSVFVIVILLVQICVLSVVVINGRILSAEKCTGNYGEITFTVYENGKITNAYNTSYIEITGGDLSGSRVMAYYSGEALTVGSKATAKAYFQEIDNDYKLSNYCDKVYLTASLSDVVLADQKDGVLAVLEEIRGYIKDTAFRYVSKDEAATLLAMILGDKSYFSNEFYSNVKAAGVSHVMVVSGMHLSILITLVIFILEKFLYNKTLKAIVMFGTVLFLTALCGFTTSIIRAGVMYLFYAIAILINRKAVSENLLGAAVCVILIVSPYTVFDLSFQLSVLSTFGILSVALPIENYLRSRNIITSKLLSAAVFAGLVTLCALILTTPLTIYVFGYISVVSIFTNILITFAATLSLWLAFSALVLNLVLPILAEFVFKICEIVLKYINYVINLFGSFPFATVSMPKSAAFISGFVCVAVFVLLLACKKRLDIIKSDRIREKIISEGGKTLKWQ